MTSRAQILAEIDAITAVAARLAAIAQRTDAQRKQDLIVARRELAMRIMTVMAIGEGYRPLRDHEQLYPELRQRVSSMRAAIADHQAQWSAVAIDSDDAAYLSSSAALQAMGRELMAWIRTTVISLPEST
ncbi:MAG: hypothetical protein C0476_09695 [Sphingomonas sp.]|nr:hypothetical protein [Sphingomonas sp.]